MIVNELNADKDITSRQQKSNRKIATIESRHMQMQSRGRKYDKLRKVIGYKIRKLRREKSQRERRSEHQ